MYLCDLIKDVEDYTEKLILDAMGDIKIPLDIKFICEYYGLSVYVVEDKNISNRCILEDDIKTIYLNKDNLVKTNRFIMAYSLGLLVYCHFFKQNCDYIIKKHHTSGFGKDLLEIYLMKFARAILLPKIIFKDWFNLVSVEQISNDFEIELDQVKKRIYEMKNKY